MMMLFTVASGVLFSTTDFGKALDGLFFDRVASFLGTARNVLNPVVILIGEDDYTKAGTPLALWGTRLVPLLERIEQGKPKAIGLDMILPQFPLDHIIKNHDRQLLKTIDRISKQCRIISGYGIAEGGRIKEPFVLYQKVFGPSGYGYLNLTPDSDMVCRRQGLTVSSDKGDRTLYSFSWLLAGKKGPPPMEAMPDWRNPARIPTYTFQQALTADPACFTGRIVIIGVDFDFEDRHPTPASPNYEPGVVFQARVVEALRSGRLLSAPSWIYSLLAPAVMMVGLVLFLTRKPSLLRVTLSGAGVLTGLAALTAGCLAGGSYSSLLLPPSACLPRARPDFFRAICASRKYSVDM